MERVESGAALLAREWATNVALSRSEPRQLWLGTAQSETPKGPEPLTVPHVVLDIGSSRAVRIRGSSLAVWRLLSLVWTAS